MDDWVSFSQQYQKSSQWNGWLNNNFLQGFFFSNPKKEQKTMWSL